MEDLLFLLLLALVAIFGVEAQLHDREVTTEPSWAPTGRLNQFNGFATPRPSLLPQNAQMVYASVWAAWSSWSFCSDSKRIRVRACNTVRGFRCLGPNQETEPCDPSTSPILGRPPRPNTIVSDYDTVDPWQEDRLEALKQLYPDESFEEKLSHLPEHEKQRMLAAPVGMSHELLQRPQNSGDGAPGATPERMFGARAFAVKNQNAEEIVKVSELFDKEDAFADITDKQKSRGEGTFTRKTTEKKGKKLPAKVDQKQKELQDIEEVEAEMEKLVMDGPKFKDSEFKEDIFGSIDELMMVSESTEATEVPPTTVIQTTVPPTTKRTTTTTVPPTTTTTTTTVAPTTTRTTSTVPPTTVTTTRRPPTRVTPRLPTVPAEDVVELVTPTMIKTAPEVISFFNEEEMMAVEEITTKKPWKNAIHFGEVTPVKPTVATTTVAPTTTSTASGFPIPEEISLDTLHALDWMLANMTKAAEDTVEGNELRRRLDSSPMDQTAIVSTKVFSKKPLHRKKNRKNPKTHRTKVITLHYGEVVPAKEADRKFPKFRTRNTKRAKIFGIKTSNVPEAELTATRGKKEELVEEINDLKDLMEQLDERAESRSALMEDTFDSLVAPKHEHNSPYRNRHRQV